MTSPVRRATAAVTIAAATAALFGCAPEPAPATSASASAPAATSAEPTPTPTPTPARALSPLRGTIVLASSITGPALAAKIDNHWDARPQCGLEHTDIVYEELVEGGLTRYVAVWFSDVPKEIGPVRSIRPMDPDIISPLGGIVAYSGGQARFVAMMQGTDVHNAIHGGRDDRYMYRSTKKAAPHNVVVEARKLRAAYAKIAPPVQQFDYPLDPAMATAPVFGSAVKGFDLRFSASSRRGWRWDAASGAFVRSQDGRKDLDSAGVQLRATNVVAMTVAIDGRYGYVPKTVMVGSGTAWVATGGKAVEARWSKTSRTAPVVLTRTNGLPLYLAAGNTWVELVPKSGSVAVVR